GPQVTDTFVRSIFREQRRQIEMEIRDAMTGMSLEAIEEEVAAYAAAASDAESVFLDPDFRPFLCCESPPAHLTPDEERMVLRGKGHCE
ncbi:MAG: hypothetical protein KJO98_07470, partial [Rhodothermia bacterium]|nr:hypothetical protein [Rhodothermia bacterium]